MAVSSLVPASAGITVAEGTAAGWGAPAWVQLADTTVTTATSYTFTGLSGYKKLKFSVNGIETLSTAGLGYIIFNSDTTSGNYSWTNTLMQNGQTAPFKTIFGSSTAQINLSAISAGGYQFHSIAEIDNVSGSHKHVRHRTHVSSEDYYWAAQPTTIEGFGTYRSNTVISSMTFIMPSVTNGSGKIHIWGQA